MICLFKFCFHDVTRSLQRTKILRKKMTCVHFLQLGLSMSEGLAGGGPFSEARGDGKGEGSAERHGRRPRLGQAVERTLTCSQRAPSKSAGPGVNHPREVLPSLRDHTRYPFL